MSALVHEARTWRGVFYLHQGRNRNGVDCAGFPWCVYAALGVVLEDFRAYGTEADPSALIAHLRRVLGPEVKTGPVRFTDLQAGDIVVFHFPRSKSPRHLAFIADRAPGKFNFIESNGNEGRVLERRLDEKYLARVTHVFRRPV